ncbi:MAG: GNAT family N-acetyltransferase [Chloroflexi bacterium]|nr:GNAT family N-acetyltransferase [Chloroflexota bacterium]
MSMASRRHLHLDWRTMAQWMPHPDLRGLVSRQNSLIKAFMGATLHHPSPHGSDQTQVAWLRFAMPANPFGVDRQLDMLWEALLSQLQADGVQRVAFLTSDRWAEAIARRWGFDRLTQIVTLVRVASDLPAAPPTPFSTIDVRRRDIEQISAVDATAFEALWQYSAETLDVAAREAATFTAISDGERFLGYQLSTRYINSAHLARLAVRPDQQGRGLGKVLVAQMLNFFAQRGIDEVTVNTQADNERSLRLYKKMGFNQKGRGVPVYILTL